MHMKKIREAYRRQPFQAFDLRTSDGRVYTVEHPEFLKLYHKVQAVNYTTDDDRDIIIDADQIVAIEAINHTRRAK